MINRHERLLTQEQTCAATDGCCCEQCDSERCVGQLEAQDKKTLEAVDSWLFLKTSASMTDESRRLIGRLRGEIRTELL